MKYVRLFHIIGVLALSNLTWSQINQCVQDRYAQTALFDSLDIEQLEYTYSVEETWPSAVLDTLKIEVFKPYDVVDPIQKRPFILMIHGGTFLAGNKGEMGYFSMEMARRGFVSGTIDYRLGWDCNPASAATICLECGTQASKLRVAVYRAVQDSRAALRFIIENADLLGIDTSQIYVQGTSAGSITALHTAFWDQTEASAFCPTCVTELGNLDDSGLSPQHNFSIKGVVNNCGSVSSLAVMDNASIPVIGFHDEWDCTVPYQGGNVIGCLGCTAFYYSSGSSSIRSKLNTDGVCYGLNTVPLNLNHCSYPSNAIIGKATCFIKSIMCNQCTSYTTTNIWDIPDCMSGTTSVELTDLTKKSIKLFPNPAEDILNIHSDGTSISSVSILSTDGREVSYRLFNEHQVELNLSSLTNGVYFVKIGLDDEQYEVHHVIVE